MEDEACVVADEDDEEDEDEGYKIQDRGIVIDANDGLLLFSNNVIKRSIFTDDLALMMLMQNTKRL